ncbi:DNA-binding transcriptional response regulator, NtrC family, contains REC, AAA-type ATPase, and a Fis-type DNA-binding domains [Lishizhenia tianjinensis]|uniref:DNA-binding transcriptional response regulator, NtrC family, contains REC, AAA-type ATPase, and a Fis-type DNA-binding domains n=1 Tax=Lishizhenia tianjinensis TaxID=477690 RepID=A0A1I6YCG1_9FLAO|nr:sigma-54 dependent transcriptional regulator [Lishizhenia tianjinensis]SFT48215.1 DNA-binding transcriptional response regulator, NtrC family, contains REC, AAA-type ATPase, and a Fis-type DNA-binding domains [Lishizhenia tianjinensis]
MKNSPSILIVDDSRDMLELLRRQLESFHLIPIVSDNVIDAIEILETTQIDVLITDINMPEVSGEQLIRYASEHFTKLPILVISGYPNLETAVNVMKLGALEYLVKPFSSDELKEAVFSLLPEETLKEEKTQITAQNSFQGIIGSSPKMQELFKTIERTKSNKATILISGESGTGKELIARAIHYNSDFSASPFVPVNCGAIPDNLIESELFGHVKGSFTGAIADRVGFFQAAHTGTLFLDEISNTSQELQAKLLRVIQEKEVTRIGDTKAKKIDLRIITASNVNLQNLIDKGQFREDLYYRLNVISLNIPPLRERNGDIKPLVNFFNKKYSKEFNKKPLKIAPRVYTTFENYSWPGNVRELENLIQRLVVMHDDAIGLDEIPQHIKTQIDTLPEKDSFETLKEHEIKYIKRVLLHCDNNKTKAAQILDIDRKTLREKLK